MELMGGTVRGYEDDDELDLEAFMRNRRLTFVLGVMAFAAAIGLSGAVAAATHDEPVKKTMLGYEAPQRPEAIVEIGPIEWSAPVARANHAPKKHKPTAVPAIQRPTRIRR